MINRPSQDNSEEFDDEEFDDEEFDDEDAETPEGSGTEAAKNFLLSRRGLLVGALATAGLGVAGYLSLREKGPGGKVLMDEYEKIAGITGPSKKSKLTDAKLRHMHVLKQAAARNMPGSWNNFVTIEAKGSKGTEVKFEAAPHGLYIGHDGDYIETPLDGPHAMATAEILGYSLPSMWMVQAIARQAMKFKGKKGEEKAVDGKGKVKFIAAPEIAKKLGIPWVPSAPDGWWMESPQFVRTRNKLLQEWLAAKKIGDDQLISGYGKEICLRNETKNGKKGIKRWFRKKHDDKKQVIRLEFYGGYNDQGDLIQGSSGGVHPAYYFDYSHIVRLVKPQLTVNGKSMTLDEFHDNLEFAQEFGFDKSKLVGYPYSPELAKFVEDNK